MARKYWPKEDPVGRRITIGKGVGPEFEEPTREIVGIVGNVRESGLTEDNQGVMYVPADQVANGLTQLANKAMPLAWAVRTSTEPLALSKAVQREFLSSNIPMPISRIRTMQQVISRVTARQDFNMLLLTVFAGAALLLASIGIYGLMSYSVEQRTQEIGIRIALGAGTRETLRMVLRQGLLLAAIGMAIGLVAAWFATRLLASMLFGVKATDPIAFAAVAATLGVVACVASFIPARRATHIDPVVALRYE